MVEAVTFPDVETLAVTYLRAKLSALSDGAVVATKVPNPRPDRLVRVTRNGGSATYPGTDRPIVVVQCWDTSTVDASELARVTRALMWALPGDSVYGADVRKAVEFGGPAFFPDPATTLPRYQFSYQLHIKGFAL